jgi:rubredoxin
VTAYRCPGCDYVYDEATGAPREGFPAGTTWDQVPDEWCCPDCAVREKVDFEVEASEATENEVEASEATGNETEGVSK